MNHVIREAFLPYTTQQLYDLVNTIEDYPKFLHWCKSARIVSKTEHEITATLVIAKAGLHKAFTTLNTLTPPHRIDIKLVNGPFKHLTGHWKFENTPNGCKVSIDLEFEFASRILELMFGPVFHEIVVTLIRAFTTEAHRRFPLCERKTAETRNEKQETR